MNVITATAEAVRDAINAASLAETIGMRVTAIRQWLPTVKLEQIDGVLVLVVAKATTGIFATRAKDFDDVEIDVAVFTKLTNDDEATADTLFDLIENIHGIMRVGLSDPRAGFRARKTDPIFDVTTLETQRVLRSATTYTFNVYHDVRL